MQFASPESGCVPGRSAELPYPQGANLRKVREVDEAVGRLVRAGNTIIVIEHDMQVIAQSDWIIDIAPGPVTRAEMLSHPEHRMRWLHPRCVKLHLILQQRYLGAKARI